MSWVRCLRQMHVLLAVSMLAKLAWFHARLNQPYGTLLIGTVTVGTVMVLVAWLPLVPLRQRLWGVWLIDLVVSLLILCDLLYFRFYETLLSTGLIRQAGQTGDVWASILTLTRISDAWLFIDLIVLSVLWKTLGVVELAGDDRAHRSKRVRMQSAIAGAVGLALGVGPVIVQARLAHAFSLWDMGVYQHTGLVGFHAFDLGRTINSALGRETVTPEELEDVADRLTSSGPSIDLPDAPPSGEWAGSNVLMVQVEALQSAVVGKVVSGEEVTPHLNSLIRSSIWFPDMRHQVGLGHTADAEWLTGCSLYPARSGIAFTKFASHDLTCLPEILGERGYSSAVHHANQPQFWNRQRAYPAMGYDRFFDGSTFVGERRWWGVNDRDFLTQTVDQLRTRRQPFYDVAITMTSHHPYRMDGEGPRIDAGSLESTVLGDYLDAVNYTDEAIGEMIAALKSTGLWENTIVVVYGDHDSNINDPDLFAELMGEPISQTEMFELRTSVPLIVHLPDGAYGGTRVDQPVGQIDVAPLLARLLDVPPRDTSTFLGSDPFRERHRPVVMRNGAFVTSDFLYPTPDGPCVDRSTSRHTNPAACLTDAALAAEDLRVSDLINEFNLGPHATKEP